MMRQRHAAQIAYEAPAPRLGRRETAATLQVSARDDGDPEATAGLSDADPPDDAHVSLPKPGLLSELERQVVHLSVKDGVGSNRTSGPPFLRWGKMASGRISRPLANPKLEALRHYAVHFRSSGNLPNADDRAAILAAGYNEAQVRTIEDLVGTLQPDLAGQQWSPTQKGVALAGAAMFLGACLWLGYLFEDGVAAVIVLGLLAVTIASFFSRASR